MEHIVPPHILAQFEALAPVEKTIETATPLSSPRVVLAPVTHGRSFSLRCSYGPHFSLGQMLVLIDKEHYGSPMEVIGTLFPTTKTSNTGKAKDRVFLGDRKLGKRFVAGIMEIKITPGEAMTYRMLYPSGKEFQEWKPFDLEKLRLKTTETQRAFITTFTGIIYKSQEASAPRPKKSKHRHDSGFSLNDIVTAAFDTKKPKGSK